MLSSIIDNENIIRWSTYCAQMWNNVLPSKISHEVLNKLYDGQMQVVVKDFSIVSDVTLTMDEWKLKMALIF